MFVQKKLLIFHETSQIFQLRFVGHTFLSDSELELTLMFELRLPLPTNHPKTTRNKKLWQSWSDLDETWCGG